MGLQVREREVVKEARCLKTSRRDCGNVGTVKDLRGYGYAGAGRGRGHVRIRNGRRVYGCRSVLHVDGCEHRENDHVHHASGRVHGVRVQMQTFLPD